MVVSGVNNSPLLLLLLLPASVLSMTDKLNGVSQYVRFFLSKAMATTQYHRYQVQRLKHTIKIEPL